MHVTGSGRLEEIPGVGLAASAWATGSTHETLPGALEEENRHGHAGKVFRPLDAGFSGSVQRKAEKGEAANSLQWRFGLGAGSHPAAE